MRVFHIMASTALGGAETYSADVILSLHAQGVDQVVAMPKNAPRFGDLVRAGVRTVPEPFLWPFAWMQKRVLHRLIAREKPDIVQSWMRRGAYLAGAPQGSKPVILGWFGGYYKVKKFENCAHLVGVTKGIVAHMVENGIPVERAHFIPTFPDVQAMPPVDRATLATPREAKVLLALSRLHPKKGLDTLLAALKEIPDGILWLAGDGPLRKELEYMARKHGIIDRVRFLGWRNDRAALLRSADVCVLPSRYEPFGTVILEAWASGTPLVACASAGPAAHVDHEVTGMLSPIDDAPALAKALRRVLDDRALRQKLIANGYAAYVKGYTREAVTRQWLDFYKTIAG